MLGQRCRCWTSIDSVRAQSVTLYSSRTRNCDLSLTAFYNTGIVNKITMFSAGYKMIRIVKVGQPCRLPQPGLVSIQLVDG